jgi:hypothetical protein
MNSRVPSNLIDDHIDADPDWPIPKPFDQILIGDPFKNISAGVRL